MDTNNARKPYTHRTRVGIPNRVYTMSDAKAESLILIDKIRQMREKRL